MATKSQDRKLPSDTLSDVEKVGARTGVHEPGRVYVIWRTPGAGFFSIVASTLAHIHMATSQGHIPVVDFDSHDSVYRENEPVHGTSNMWEYYFEQPGGLSTREIGDDFISIDGRWPKGYPYDLSASPLYREVWLGYIKLTPVTKNYIDSSSETLQISRRTLGVHFRGQEMRTARGHRYPPTLRQMRDAITWNFENAEFDDIFLVTEAQQYVDYFVKFFGTRVIPSPSFRLLHRNSYTLTQSPRKHHKYLLGLEALRDAIVLSRCGGLVCGRSNLSEAAIMLSENVFMPITRISQGRNSFRPYVSPIKWYVKALLPEAMGGFPRWSPGEAP